ncbi:MAG: LuxR C-terminal-related transcriptional regulator, partial [Thermomicrobiales bacterium]
SYALLDPDQRAGFRRLAVFLGGFTLDAAQDVLGADLDALDLVEFLVARSLVVPMASESAHPRFTMVESIRQFGVEELLTTGEDETVRAAHADWLIRLADHATPFLDGPELGRYLTILNEEMDNYRAAIAWSIQEKDGRRANRLTGGIWRIWGSGESRWRPRRSVDEARREARSWTEQALALSEGVPFADVVEAMAGMGLLMDTVKDLEPKRILMEELLQRSREASLPHGAYWAHFALADIARARGDWQAARAEAEAAIALAPLIRDPDNQRAGAEIHLAGMFASEGNLEAARDHYLLALEYGERAGNPLHLALATLSLASMHRRLGNAGPSADYALRALDLLAALKDVARTRIPYMTLAELARTAGRRHEAIRFLAHAASVPSFMNGTEVDDTWLTRFRALLPPAGFTSAWEEGTAASPEVMREWAQDFAHSLEATSAPDLLILTVPLLTPREEDVLRLLVGGRTNRAIGDALFISERTVEKHVLHIMTKLDLDSRTGIVAWAVRNGVA